MKWLIGGIVFFCIGIVFVIDPAQFLVNNEIISKKINSNSKYRSIFKFFGVLLLIIGVIAILFGLIK